MNCFSKDFGQTDALAARGVNANCEEHGSVHKAREIILSGRVQVHRLSRYQNYIASSTATASQEQTLDRNS